MSATPTVSSATKPAWQHQLAKTFFVNSVAISADGSRVFAGTFYHNYAALLATEAFGVYYFDRNGNQLWSQAESLFEGIYWVALSADGNVAAAAGWQQAGQGFLAAYDAASGNKLLNYTGATARVSAATLSADGSSLVAYSNQTVYLFTQQNGSFNPTPSTWQASAAIEAVALSPNGDWLAACDANGTVYFATIAGGVIGTPVQWSASATMHAMAAATNAPYFAAGGDDGNLYLFDAANSSGAFSPVASLATGGPVRWVALTADASRATAVSNIGTAGMLMAASFDGTNLTQLWQSDLKQNPNCTSLDGQGSYVAVADGYNGPGNFYLFDGATGKELWCYPTPKMNWPIFLSADGSGVAAGSDDGIVYYFNAPES